MYHSARRRRDPEQRIVKLEIALVVLCVAAIVALVVWIVSTAGGGALMT